MSENIQELIDAAKELLTIVKNIPYVSLSSISEAWERLDKAVRTLEAQERNDNAT